MHGPLGNVATGFYAPDRQEETEENGLRYR